MIKSIIKEIIIMLLLFIVLALVLGIIFYDYIPTSKQVPEKIAYTMPEEIKKNLENSVVVSSDKVIVTYEISNDDLKTYERNKNYNKGKINPFSDVTTPVSNTTNNSNNNTNTQTGNNNNNIDNTTNVNTNSTGTFFEQSGTK